MNKGILSFPESVKTETVLYATGARGATAIAKNWQLWQKPRGCQFVSIFALGAGGGGGNGFSGAAGTGRGGGGGGGSGAVTRVIYLASMLPDNLWIQVPKGGGAGQVGGRALVCISRSFSSPDILITSGTADAGAGGNGTASAAGTAGAASSLAAITTGIVGLAIAFTPQVGYAGLAGGAHTGANGANLTPIGYLTGGAGGGGTTSANFAGGSILAAGEYQFRTPLIQGGLAGSNAGQSGLSFFSGLFTHRGGAGGGSNNTGIGGNGGDGGLGCGGGGGGGGTTGGTGGNGGDGLVIISTW